jgi:hypothetical protein
VDLVFLGVEQNRAALANGAEGDVTRRRGSFRGQSGQFSRAHPGIDPPGGVTGRGGASEVSGCLILAETKPESYKKLST